MYDFKRIYIHNSHSLLHTLHINAYCIKKILPLTFNNQPRCTRKSNKRKVAFSRFKFSTHSVVTFCMCKCVHWWRWRWVFYHFNQHSVTDHIRIFGKINLCLSEDDKNERHWSEFSSHIPSFTIPRIKWSAIESKLWTTHLKIIL